VGFFGVLLELRVANTTHVLEPGDESGTEQNRTEQNRTEQNRTEQNRTEQNRTEQNRTEQNRTEQNRIEQNKIIDLIQPILNCKLLLLLDGVHNGIMCGSSMVPPLVGRLVF
jgi:hypothetical protein